MHDVLRTKSVIPWQIRLKLCKKQLDIGKIIFLCFNKAHEENRVNCMFKMAEIHVGRYEFMKTSLFYHHNQSCSLSLYTITYNPQYILLHGILSLVWSHIVTTSQKDLQISVIRRKERKVDGSGFFTSSMISCIYQRSRYFEPIFKFI